MRGVSLTRRILEGARTGLAQLTSLVIVDDEPLSHVEASVLEAELATRRKARSQPPGHQRIATLAGASPQAKAERDRLAADRQRTIHGDREARETAQKRSTEDAFRRIKEQAARGGGSSKDPAARGGGSSTRKPPPSSGRVPRPGSADAQVADWYKALNLNFGADLAEVKAAYRQLMRRYHPDLHTANPQKQKAANELSMRVTSAYNGLQIHLGNSKE
jgi:DnaJ-domain-containing protein 1